MSDLRLLKLSEVIDQVNLSRAHLYNLVAQGNFPAPLKFGKLSRWRSDEVDAWITSDAHPRAVLTADSAPK